MREGGSQRGGGGRRCDPQGSRRRRADARHPDPPHRRHRRPADARAGRAPVFADGWQAKALVETRLGRPLPREAVALAINSKWARSQDQLHVHVDCVAKPVAAALADYRLTLDDHWRAMTVPLAGRAYFARRLDSADLRGASPFRLLADGLEGAKADIVAYSLAAVGATFDDKPGFILLADSFSLEGGGHAEDIQDHGCEIALPAP